MTDVKMKTWQRTQPVVSGSRRKLQEEKSCLLTLLGRGGNMRNTFSSRPPPSSNIKSLPLCLCRVAGDCVLAQSACLNIQIFRDLRLNVIQRVAFEVRVSLFRSHLGTLVVARLCWPVSCWRPSEEELGPEGFTRGTGGAWPRITSLPAVAEFLGCVELCWGRREPQIT